MPTVREVQAGVAAMFYCPLSVAGHYIRVLKESDASPPVWFRVGKGKTEAPLTESHLTNIILAFAVGSPVDGPENVAIFRSMKLILLRKGKDKTVEYFKDESREPLKYKGIIIYPTLGETLDFIIKNGYNGALSVDISTNVAMNSTTISIIQNSTVHNFKFSAISADMIRYKEVTVNIIRTTELTGFLFEKATEILRLSKNETAASPARDTADLNQTDSLELGETEHPQVRRERKISQSSSKPSAGISPKVGRPSQT